MPSTSITTLRSTVSKLHAERRTHEQAINEIDAIFAQFGINGKTTKRSGAKRKGPGRPKGKTTKRRRGPGRPKKTRRGRKPGKRKAAPAKTKQAARSTGKLSGPEFIKGVIKAGGKAGAETSEIFTAWKKARRKGRYSPFLSIMVKARKVQKRKIKGQKKGSVYRIA